MNKDKEEIELGNFMFGVVPNENGEIECIADQKGNQIGFKITQADINHMQRYLHLWNASKLMEKAGTE